jgi:hypothetical protein
MEKQMVDKQLTLIIQVHLTTGLIKEHKYHIAQIEDATKILNSIANSFTKKTLQWLVMQKDIPQILALEYPMTMYNPSHVMLIEHRIEEKVVVVSPKVGSSNPQ